MTQDGDLIWRELKEAENFEPLALIPDAPFTQGSFYGEWQKTLGQKVRRLVVERKAETIIYLQIVKYAAPLGRSYLYAPYGPVMKSYDEAALRFLRHRLKLLASEEKAVFVRLDFTPAPSAETLALLKKYFRLALKAASQGVFFQPRAEWQIDLTRSEDELLQAMSRTARYSIKFAERQGIKTAVIDDDLKPHLEDFYQLLTETATRQGFSLHPYAYYENIFATLGGAHRGYLVEASYQGKILVSKLVITYGATATETFTGSSRQESWRQATYLAQWAAMREAKRRGLRRWSSGGVNDGQSSRKNWAGLTGFKQKFGGEVFRHGPLLDLIVQPFWYMLYNLRKIVRSWL